jgi:uncharacterized protein (TIGR01777 family)
MRVALTGGTGFIGARLCRTLLASGHTPIVLSRNPESARRLGGGVEVQRWEPGQEGEWESALAGAEAIVNLAGESIGDKRWSERQKAAIRESRISSTRSLIDAMRRADRRPNALLNASASGYYGSRGDEPVTESEPPGTDFLARVCQEWEGDALAARQLGLRVVLVRTGIALGSDGGALPKLLPPFKMFVGGPLASGKQAFPWVHVDDVVGIYQWALENEAVEGPLNAAAPQPLTNKEFCQALARALGRPCWAPVPGFALKLLLGEMADPLLLQGQKLVPARTEQLGYQFRFRTVDEALQDLLR